jgi:hypothetical protein
VDKLKRFRGVVSAEVVHPVNEFPIVVFTQEAADPKGYLQSHVWAELPAAIAGPFLSGGLKLVRRMSERYFSYRFLDGARRVRATWRSGEPHLQWRFYHLPGLDGRELIHAGRFRTTGTRDVYRGFHEVRGGALVDPAAVAARRPWPDDMPWVAPSAGEFISAEKARSSYLGIFELRVERSDTGCVLHAWLVDFPPAAGRLATHIWKQAWAPLRGAASAEFLRREIGASAHEQELAVRFETQARAGVPARPRFLFDPAPPVV